MGTCLLAGAHAFVSLSLRVGTCFQWLRTIAPLPPAGTSTSVQLRTINLPGIRKVVLGRQVAMQIFGGDTCCSHAKCVGDDPSGRLAQLLQRHHRPALTLRRDNSRHIAQKCAHSILCIAFSPYRPGPIWHLVRRLHLEQLLPFRRSETPLGLQKFHIPSKVSTAPEALRGT